MGRREWAGFVVVGVLSAVPAGASAGGFEYAAPGTRANGRAGAYAARADDPMALGYNPAHLADNEGSQFLVNLNLAFLDACYTRAGNGVLNYNNTGADVSRFGTVSRDDIPANTYLGEPFAEVCHVGPPGIGPAIGYTTRINDEIGIGFGILAPNAAGHLVWGDQDGVVETPNGIRPSGGRYMLVEEQLIILHPTVGIGWRATPWLRVGASLQPSIGYFDFKTIAVATHGENPEADIYSRLTVSDWFIPAFVVSAHVVPHDNLDLTVAFRWSDDVSATGTTDLTHGYYGTSQPPDSYIPTTVTVDDTELDAPQPATLTFGARYAHRLRPRAYSARERAELVEAGESSSMPEGTFHDSMTDELFDVELDVVYEFNSHVKDFVIHMPETANIRYREYNGSDMITANAVAAPREIVLPHRWDDQISVRLGGDVNVIPGKLAIRAGANFETRGVNPSYQSLDFMPAQRVGVHLGATWRVGDFDLSLALAHIFQETITVNPNNNDGIDQEDEARLEQISADNDGFIVNAGKYTASWNVVSIGMNYRY